MAIYHVVVVHDMNWKKHCHWTR